MKSPPTASSPVGHRVFHVFRWGSALVSLGLTRPDHPISGIQLNYPQFHIVVDGCEIRSTTAEMVMMVESLQMKWDVYHRFQLVIRISQPSRVVVEAGLLLGCLHFPIYLNMITWWLSMTICLIDRGGVYSIFLDIADISGRNTLMLQSLQAQCSVCVCVVLFFSLDWLEAIPFEPNYYIEDY